MDRLTLAPLSDYDVGALFAVLIAYAAYRVHALTALGALAAVFVGTAVYGSGTLAYSAVLLTFFLTSIGLSRVGRARKAALDAEKHGARDGAQVLANGGVAALCALIAAHDPRWAAGFAGAFAAATADTWATEIGSAFGGTPRSILTLRSVPAGISGGITFVGTAASLAGAALVAAVAAALGVAAFLPVFIGGVTGTLLDSLVGASAQALRWCPQCRRVCESEPHAACGANTTLVRGMEIVSNDAVNLLATLGGAAAALAAVRLF